MQAYKIMHGLWGMGQMMFTKYIVVVDDDVDVHNTSEVLFRLCDPKHFRKSRRADSPKRPMLTTSAAAHRVALQRNTRRHFAYAK